MTLSDKLSDVSKAIYVLLQELDDFFVHYGEQEQIPRMPAIVVIPRRNNKELIGTGHTADVELIVDLQVFHTDFWRPDMDREQCLVSAEAIDNKLLTDKTLGGLIVHGFVTSMETGYGESRTGNQVYVMTTMTWRGISRSRLTASTP